MGLLFANTRTNWSLTVSINSLVVSICLTCIASWCERRICPSSVCLAFCLYLEQNRIQASTSTWVCGWEGNIVVTSLIELNLFTTLSCFFVPDSEVNYPILRTSYKGLGYYFPPTAACRLPDTFWGQHAWIWTYASWQWMGHKNETWEISYILG